MPRGRYWLLSIACAWIAALVSGCGSSVKTGTPASPTTATGSTTAAEEAEQANGDCTSALTQHEVRVTIYGGGAKACEKFDVGAAKSANEFWRVTAEEPHGHPVCSMEQGSLLLEVRDGGGQVYGTQICAHLLATGWHEVEGPGEKDERQQEETDRRQKEQQARNEARQTEEERPAHEAAANKFAEEAASLRSKQHGEQAAAKHDEAEAQRISTEAEHAEGEAASDLAERSDAVQQNADAHEQNADGYGSEADAKESEAAKERERG